MIRITVGTMIMAALLVVAGAVSILLLGGARERRSLDRVWAGLERAGGDQRFDPAMVAGLPEPAQRYFLHAIAPGTPLANHVVLRMHGTIRLRDDAAPLPMRAEQVLAPPHGFVWKARVGRGLMRIRGSDSYTDGRGRMHWRLWGLVPTQIVAGWERGGSWRPFFFAELDNATYR